MSSEIQVTRRKFLKGAATAVAAPYLITSSALGAQGRPAASNRITMGQIGIGNQGRGILGGFLGNPTVQMVAVCDVNPNHRQEALDRIKGKYEGAKAYNDFRELIARDDIDAVVIAVPDHWHAILTIEAAKAGKDIYCEKPLSLTIHEARAMADAVRTYGRVFQTGSMQRSDGRFRLACELVRNGRIGQVHKITIGLPNNGKSSSEQYVPEQPVPAGFDYDMWLGPAPWKPYNSERVSGDYSGGWRYFRDHSGGMLTDWGAHHFDIAQWALGMDHSGPTEIYPPDGKDYPTLTYKYANGVVMALGGPGTPNGILFEGDKGKVFVSRSEVRTEPEEIGKQPIAPTEINLYNSRSHQGNWIECIQTRKLPICDVEVGARSATVCHLGNIAVWLGRPIRWDPLKEQIIGDDEANRWLDRPTRAPWHL